MKLKLLVFTAILAGATLFSTTFLPARAQAETAAQPVCEQDLKFFGSQCLKVGRTCTFNSDCCSDDCSFGKCKGQGGCKASLNGACTFNSDCCEGDCNFGKCTHGFTGCKSNPGGSCTFNSDCCGSNDCHFGKCRGAGGCTKDYGESCSFNSDCCEGSCDFGKCK